MAVIQKEAFPYIQALEMKDCYAYQNLDIVINESGDIPFKHLILTGKNGSGKTTVLDFLNHNISYLRKGNDFKNVIRDLQHTINTHPLGTNKSLLEKRTKELKEYENVSPVFSKTYNSIIGNNAEWIFGYYKAPRETKIILDTQPNSIEAIEQVIFEKNKNGTSQFQQLLVNKKVFQVFSQLNKQEEEVHEIDLFFSKLEEILQKVLEDDKLQLTFYQENFSFDIEYSDGRKINFNQLSLGASALLNVVFSILMKDDLVKGKNGNKKYSPCGIVLIDEPETHLHLELQYQVLPLLTTLFPNIQFIVATHSPAVISSIKNATVYDLSTQKTVADWIVGSSFSELMTSHFGLDNEFSDIADDIMEQTQVLVNDKSIEAKEKYYRLKEIFEENERYLSTSLKLALEVQVLKLEKQLFSNSL